jgi:hypothetical protein
MVQTQSHTCSRVWMEVANRKDHLLLWGRPDKDKPPLHYEGRNASSTLSPQMTWKDHNSLGNKAILCIHSPPPHQGQDPVFW